jgi:hypothetical protein
MTGDEDYRHFVFEPQQLFLQIDATHSRHSYIKDNAAGRRGNLRAKEFIRGSKRTHF